MLFSSTVKIRVRINVWLVSGYAHAFVQLSVVIDTLPFWDGQNFSSDDSKTLSHPLCSNADSCTFILFACDFVFRITLTSLTYGYVHWLCTCI